MSPGNWDEPQGNASVKLSAGSLKQPGSVAAIWKRLAITLADRAQDCLDNAHWEVRDGSGDLIDVIREVRIRQGKDGEPQNND